MKTHIRLLALPLAAVCCAALAACGTGDAAPAASATPIPDEVLSAPASPPEDGMEIDPEMSVTPETDADAPESAETEPDAALSALVDAIYETYAPEIALDTRAVDLTDAAWVVYYTGLSSADGLDAAVASEPLIGSHAYSMVLARVKDAADAQATADAMLEGVDPAKWICVSADKLRVVTFGDTVLLAMANSELVDVDAVVDAALPLTEANAFDYDMSKAMQE